MNFWIFNQTCMCITMCLIQALKMQVWFSVKVAESDTSPLQKNSSAIKMLQLNVSLKELQRQGFGVPFPWVWKKWIFLMYFFICWKFPKFLDIWFFFFFFFFSQVGNSYRSDTLGDCYLINILPKFSHQFLQMKCLLFETFHFLGNFLRQRYKLTQKRLETLKWKKLVR